MDYFHQAVRLLSEVYGIEREYIDNSGRVIRTRPETAALVLRAKGVRLEPPRVAGYRKVLVVSEDGLPERCTLSLTGWPDEGLLERGGTLKVTEASDRVAEATFTVPSAEVSLSFGARTGCPTLSFPFPWGVKVGTYQLRVRLDLGAFLEDAEILILVCPARAYQPPELEAGRRIAGVSVALYGARSRSNWGVGDFRDLKEIVKWAAEVLHVDFVGLNPLHALSNQRPFNSSPYLPSSRFFRNFIYLDIPAVPDYEESAEARELVGSEELQTALRRLREEEQVQYEGAASAKLKVLKLLYRSFRDHHHREGDPRWEELIRYRQDQGLHLERFATFCALRGHFQEIEPDAATWRQWPQPFQDATSPEVRHFQQEHTDEVEFWMYVQWLIDGQLSDVQALARDLGMLVGLFHDEALAIDGNGADAWAWPDYVHDGFSVGAPPDAFAPLGQDWGFRPPNRERIRAAGFTPFLRKLQANCAHGGALRIDHVMQLSHLFWIPAGGKPADGVYVQDHESDLLNLLARESRLNSTLIVGEDLGTVPPDFRERLMAKGIFSYRLFYFERDRDGNFLPPYAYPTNALVSITTHDLPTLVGFWSGRDIDIRHEIGQLDDERVRAFQEDRTQHKAKMIEKLVQEGDLPAHTAHAAWVSPTPTDDLHRAVLGFLFRTPARMVQISQEDIFLDERQQNIPGTVEEHPNWVTKMRYTVEELRTNPEAVRCGAVFREVLHMSGRQSRGRS